MVYRIGRLKKFVVCGYCWLQGERRPFASWVDARDEDDARYLARIMGNAHAIEIKRVVQSNDPISALEAARVFGAIGLDDLPPGRMWHLTYTSELGQLPISVYADSHSSAIAIVEARQIPGAIGVVTCKTKR